MVAAPVMVWAAVKVDVKSGETVEIADDNYNTYVCADGATVKFSENFPASAKETAGRYAFHGSIYLTNENSVVTLDVSALPNRTEGVRLRGHILGCDPNGNPKGALVVKGTRKLFVGDAPTPTTFSSWAVASVSFKDDAGEDVTTNLVEGEGVLFAGTSTVWQNPSCRHLVLAGADIALGSVTTSDFGCFTPDADNEIKLTDKDFYIINTNLHDQTATIRVAPGRHLTFKPVVWNYPANWRGEANRDLVNPILLESSESARATFFHRASKYCFVQGSITGDGDVEFTTDNYGNPSAGLLGEMNFRGTVFVHGNTIASQAPTPSDFYIATNCPGHVDNTLKIGGSTKTIFATPSIDYDFIPRVPPQVWTNVSVKVLQGVSEDGYVGELTAVEGQTVTVHRVTGPVRLGGKGAFVLKAVAADAVVTVLPTATIVVTDETVLEPGATVVLARTADNEVFKVIQSGTPYQIEPFAGVRAVTNAVLTGQMSTSRPLTYLVHGNIDFRIGRADETWRDVLTFWADPTNVARQVIHDFTSTNDNPHLEMVHDAREGQRYLLQNNYQRTAAGAPVSSGNWHKSQVPYMYLAKNDGPVVNEVRLPYFSTGGKYAAGSARRFYAGEEGSTPYASKSIPAKFVVMVVDARQGGGMSILKDTSGGTRNVFARCDNTETPDIHMPIFTNANFTTWVDGVQVDPTQRDTLKPAWQIISFRTGGWGVGGFGYNTVNYQNGGGINYGDIMIFSEELSDSQRRDVERRLAEKWGIADYRDGGESFEVPVSGEGTIAVEPDVVIDPVGLFSGTIDLAEGATLSVGTHPAVPTTEEIGAIEGRVNWFDPDAPGAIVSAGEGSRQVTGLYDRVDDCTEEGHWFMYGSGSRYPWINESSRAFGAPVRKWLDFSYAYEDKLGNALRYRPTPIDKEGNSGTSVNYTLNVQTICSVYDSCRAGTPFMDTMAGTGLVKRRNSFTSPIWESKTATVLTNGKQYLDGVEVDGTKVSFGGKPEVFSFTTDGDFPLMCMGDLASSQMAAGGEILGESIFFNRVLSDAERRMVEAYLMVKWLGRTTGKITDLAAATVTGAGTVVAPDAAALPQLGEGFTGTVSLTNETPVLAFTLNADTVVNPLDLQGGTLTVPGSSVAVSVTFTAKAAAESYKLMSWRGGNAPAVAFALADNQPTGEVRSARYTLRKETDGLYLDVGNSETVFILR